MKIGTQADVFQRLKNYLPPWFGSNTPVLDSVLQGAAWAGSFVYQRYCYAKLQTRIKTATGNFLDLISTDFFGRQLLRRPGESDAAFRTRILINLFREAATRHAVIKILQDLTGRTPIVFEPSNITDTGAWDAPILGFDIAGAYGGVFPFNAFVTAFRPLNQGVPYVAGYDTPVGAYDVGSRLEYIATNMGQTVTDADIYAAVNQVRPIATTLWVNIQS